MPHWPHLLDSDIKPANILLDRDLNCKLADVGLARVIGRQSASYAYEGQVGDYGHGGATDGYAPPEVTEAQGTSTLISPKQDVYAGGVCLSELMARLQPQISVPANVCSQVGRIVHACLQPFDTRPKTAEVLQRLEQVYRESIGHDLEPLMGSDAGGREPAGTAHLLDLESDAWLITPTSLPPRWRTAFGMDAPRAEPELEPESGQLNRSPGPGVIDITSCEPEAQTVTLPWPPWPTPGPAVPAGTKSATAPY